MGGDWLPASPCVALGGTKGQIRGFHLRVGYREMTPNRQGPEARTGKPVHGFKEAEPSGAGVVGEELGGKEQVGRAPGPGDGQILGVTAERVKRGLAGFFLGGLVGSPWAVLSGKSRDGGRVQLWKCGSGFYCHMAIVWFDVLDQESHW